MTPAEQRNMFKERVQRRRKQQLHSSHTSNGPTAAKQLIHITPPTTT
ncbi:hypothetical protein Vi05172_g6921 [Venturia inaequalis]|nr:hypothetical protein Vi05172_g6921 [Venturia inaequalis]